MPRAPSPTQAILDDLRRLVRELRLADRAAETRAGVSAAQLFVLERLSDGEARSLGELAAATLTDPSSVSVVVKRLKTAGLVTRQRAKDDERRVAIAITPAGRAALKRAPKAPQRRLIDAIEALPAARRQSLATTLGEVIRGMHLDDSSASLFFEADAKKSGATRERG